MRDEPSRTIHGDRDEEHLSQANIWEHLFLLDNRIRSFNRGRQRTPQMSLRTRLAGRYATRVVREICYRRDKGNFFETVFSLRASSRTPATYASGRPPYLVIKRTARNRSFLGPSFFPFDVAVLLLLGESVNTHPQIIGKLLKVGTLIAAIR